MQISGEILLNKILEDLAVLSKENKDILQKLYENKLIDTEQSADIKALFEKLVELNTLVTDLQSRINIFEKSRTEITGFAKYSKLIWTIIVAVTSYLVTIGIIK